MHDVAPQPRCNLGTSHAAPRPTPNKLTSNAPVLGGARCVSGDALEGLNSSPRGPESRGEVNFSLLALR